MAEFLLELFSEEIPARMQVPAAEQLKRLASESLKAANLTWAGMETHVTPRRLVMFVRGLPQAQPDTTEERRGPRIDASDAAVEGFLRAAGVNIEQCQQLETPKGTIWYTVIHRKGRPAREVLVDVIKQIVTGLAWPKSMRWGEGSFRWVRPLHRVLALFDGKPLMGEIEPEPRTRFTFYGLTRGHRFLAPENFPVTSITDYRNTLQRAYVILDRGERRTVILSQAQKLAAAEGLVLRDDPALVEEVVGLVEWPVVLMGRIDEAFMDVPPEVLITAMRAHQRYFSLLRPDGTLAPRFILVANTETVDGGKAVVAGNERVLRARLSDAKFFWDQDRRLRLEDRVPALTNIIFHARLGSMEEKVVRLQALAAELAAQIPGAAPDKARSAALLAKADLVTGMVGEFPELQGVMGRYYALHEGEDRAVADAIAEHYAPQGPTDRCPTAPVSVAVALADKIDTLVGFFSIGEKPTGSRDPYALRRAALGAIRLIVENRLRLRLIGVFDHAAALYRQDEAVPTRRRTLAGELLAFFADRLKVVLKEKGVRHDLIDAVFSLGTEDDLVRLLARVEALAQFLDSFDGANLLTAERRAGNIVRIESKKDGVAGYGAVDPARFVQPEEAELFDALGRVQESCRGQLAGEDFAGAMASLAGLRSPVDAFFDRVTVNADDPGLRMNRLALLAAIPLTMNQVADFTRIEG